MAHYFALIHQHEPRRFSAEVPDLPCCIGNGDSAAEAVANVRTLVAGRLTALRQAEMALPNGRSLETAMAERAGRPIVKAVMISAGM